MEITTGAREQALGVLERMRETPMCRGALTKAGRRLRSEISKTLAANGVSDPLARRIAFQLVVKVDADELGDSRLWCLIATVLCEEIALLAERVGLAERQINTVLPKLSAAQLEEFLDELTRADRRIARTVLDAAIDAADPIATGRRYLAEYRLVAKQLRAIEPNIARTLANATFTAGMPLDKAMQHVQKFLTSIAKQKDHPDVARLLARAGFRAD